MCIDMEYIYTQYTLDIKFLITHGWSMLELCFSEWLQCLQPYAANSQAARLDAANNNGLGQ